MGLMVEESMSIPGDRKMTILPSGLQLGGSLRRKLGSIEDPMFEKFIFVNDAYLNPMWYLERRVSNHNSLGTRRRL